MSGALPERLRRAVAEVAPGLLTAAVDDIASGDDGEKTAEWICSALEAAWPEVLAELAAQQPEPPAGGLIEAGNRLRARAADLRDSIRGSTGHDWNERGDIDRDVQAWDKALASACG